MIIVRTPLRVSFFGGGTDFPEFFSKHGGAVLGTAIDKYIYHTASRFPSWLFDHKIRISYRKTECVKDIDEIQHGPFREGLRHVGVHGDIELGIASDLPSFSGLGSSSTFTVGLLKTLHAFKGRHIDCEKLATDAIHIERDVLHEAVGFQDQIFAAYGGINLLTFRGESTFNVERVPLSVERIDELTSNLMVFFSGITRKAQDVEQQKMKNYGNKTDSLIAMLRMVDKGLSILSGSTSLTAFGELLHKSWIEKRGLDSSVSVPAIDEIYSAALNAGAIGGKILGAGGGGFLLLFVPPEKQESVRKSLTHLHEIKIRMNISGSSVIYS